LRPASVFSMMMITAAAVTIPHYMVSVESVYDSLAGTSQVISSLYIGDEVT